MTLSFFFEVNTISYDYNIFQFLTIGLRHFSEIGIHFITKHRAKPMIKYTYFLISLADSEHIHYNRSVT